LELKDCRRQPGQSEDDATRSVTSSGWGTVTTGELLGETTSPLPDWSDAGFGVRLSNLTIPIGATIASAIFRLQALATKAGTVCRARIKGEDAGNPAAFSDEADYDGRVRTAAYVDWTVPAVTANSFYETPDFAAVIQHIIDRPDWRKGNALVVFVEDNGSDASAGRAFKSWDGSPAGSPLFICRYYEPEPAPGAAIVTIHDDSPPYTMLAEFRTAHDVNRLLVHSPADKGAGAFDFAISATDPQATRDTVRMGLVVAIRSTHPGCPAFVGRVDLIEHDPDAGIVKISGAAYDQVLFERLLPQDCIFESQAAGSIAAQLLRLANSRNPTGVWPDTSPGTPIQGQFDAGSAMLGDALNDLAGKTGDEWWLEYRVSRQKLEITLRWGPKRGEDRTSEIVLREGKDFTTATYTEDGLGSAKSAIAVGGGATLADRPAAAVSRQAASAAGKAPTVGAPSEAYSRGSAPLGVTLSREVALYFPLDSDEAILARTAQRMLEVPDNAAEAFTLVLSPLAPWDIQPGDVVRAVFPNVDFGGVERNVRILSIQPDEVTGEREIAVKVEYT